LVVRKAERTPLLLLLSLLLPLLKVLTPLPLALLQKPAELVELPLPHQERQLVAQLPPMALVALRLTPQT
jgi:hypothetical protein